MSSQVAAIQRWTPRHELVVQLSIRGLSADEVAKKTKYTPIRISQILSDPQARRIVNDVIIRIRNKMEEDVENHLALLVEHAVKRLATTIKFEDFVLGSDAKKHQDNLCLAFLKGVGILTGASQNGDGEVQEPPLNKALSTRLIEALEESNKADEIRRKEKDAVQDVDFEVVESGSNKGGEDGRE